MTPFFNNSKIFNDNIVHEGGHLALLIVGCILSFLIIAMVIYLFIIRKQKQLINNYLESVEIISKKPIEIYLLRLYKISELHNYRSQILDFKAVYTDLLTLLNSNITKYNELLHEKNFLSIVKLQHMLKDIKNLEAKWDNLADDICYYLKQDETNWKTVSNFQNIYQTLCKEVNKLGAAQIISKSVVKKIYRDGNDLFNQLYKALKTSDYDHFEDILLNINHFLLWILELTDVTPHIEFLINGWIPEQIAQFQNNKLPTEIINYPFEKNIEGIRSHLMNLHYKTSARLANDVLEVIYKADQYLSEQESLSKVYFATLKILENNMTKILNILKQVKLKLNHIDAQKYDSIKSLISKYKIVEADWLALFNKSSDLSLDISPPYNPHLLKLKQQIDKLVEWLHEFKSFLNRLDDYLVQSQNYLFKIEKYNNILDHCWRTVVGMTNENITLSFKTKITSYQNHLKKMTKNISNENNLVSETNRLFLENIYAKIEDLFVQIKQHLLLKELADKAMRYCVEYNARQTTKVANSNVKIIERMHSNHKGCLYLDVLHDADVLLNKRKSTLNV